MTKVVLKSDLLNRSSFNYQTVIICDTMKVLFSLKG